MDFSIGHSDWDARAAATRQRARGEIRATFARAGVRTEAARVFETGGLRLRFPRAGLECEAVIVNTGGGMTGGDHARIGMTVGAGARVIATTQAAEKIYRADGPGVEVDTRLEVGAGGSLAWVPQETILFDRSSLSRRLDANVAADGVLLAAEAVVFGRLAHGERSVNAYFRDDWRIRRAGRLIFADSVRLENAGATLDRPAVGNGARAAATLLYVDPAAAARLEDLRAALDGVVAAPGERLEAGASLFDDAIVARVLSPSPARLRAALVASLRALRGREAPRVWS